MNPEFEGWTTSAIPFLLMLAAFGKSAQLPLYVWLPDAMEGPTPVSALIHAATMVTAGIYLIARTYQFFLLEPVSLHVIAWVGGLTALLAATIGMAQHDIKRIMAYSTVSQLGYMFLGLGVLTTYGAAYHVFTHAFFKALLFPDVRCDHARLCRAVGLAEDFRSPAYEGLAHHRMDDAHWLPCLGWIPADKWLFLEGRHFG